MIQKMPQNIYIIKNVYHVKTEKMTVSHVKLINQNVNNVMVSKNSTMKLKNVKSMNYVKTEKKAVPHVMEIKLIVINVK